MKKSIVVDVSQGNAVIEARDYSKYNYAEVTLPFVEVEVSELDHKIVVNGAPVGSYWRYTKTTGLVSLPLPIEPPPRDGYLAVWKSFNDPLEGGEWAYEEIVIPLPDVISMRQARLALHQVQLLERINAAIVNMPEEVKIEWEYASTVDRNSKLVSTLAQQFGLDDKALDALFKTASEL